MRKNKTQKNKKKTCIQITMKKKINIIYIEKAHTHIHTKKNVQSYNIKLRF